MRCLLLFFLLVLSSITYASYDTPESCWDFETNAVTESDYMGNYDMTKVGTLYAQAGAVGNASRKSSASNVDAYYHADGINMTGGTFMVCTISNRANLAASSWPGILSQAQDAKRNWVLFYSGENAIQAALWNDGASTSDLFYDHGATLNNVNLSICVSWLEITNQAGNWTLYVEGNKIGSAYQSGTREDLVGELDTHIWIRERTDGRAMNGWIDTTAVWVDRTMTQSNMDSYATSFYNSGDYQSCANITSVVSDSCTPPASGNYAVDCSDDCVWNSNDEIPGNVTLTGSGTVNLYANWSFTGSNQHVYLNSGCQLNINSGGGFK